jgi:predicted CopG family antitoxin
MKKVNIINNNHRTNSKFKRIVIRENIYQISKNLGYAGDSFNDVLARILEKKLQLLESDSRVEARD